MSWNFDIGAAPRGRNITVKRTVKGEDKEFVEFVPEHVWLASACGKVIKSAWVPANKFHNGYWPGFAQNGVTPPIAWQPFVVPSHPNIPVQDAKAATTEPKATAESEPEQSAQIRRPEPNFNFIIDDCGGGE